MDEVKDLLAKGVMSIGSVGRDKGSKAMTPKEDLV